MKIAQSQLWLLVVVGAAVWFALVALYGFVAST
jgi:hypothetical protein